MFTVNGFDASTHETFSRNVCLEPGRRDSALLLSAHFCRSFLSAGSRAGLVLNHILSFSGLFLQLSVNTCSDL